MSNYTANSYVSDPNTPWFKIIQNIKPDSTILDVGCSGGNLGQAIKQGRAGTKVVGIEIDKDDAKRAEKLLDAVYVVNLEHEPVPDLLQEQRFDYVIFCDVIEHLVRPVETLKKVKKLLKPNGKVLFSIPNMAHMSVRLMVLAGHFEYGETGLLDKTHLHYYDQAEIYRIFAEAGYDIDVFDWISRDYPEELLESKLDNLGLKPTKKFLQTRYETAAAAYQYVGTALIAKETVRTKPRGHVSPDIHDIENYIKGVLEERDFLAREKDEVARKLHDTEVYARQLQDEIANSPINRLKQNSGNIIKKIKR